MIKNIESLQHKLLVAMPNIEDPYFSHSVIYIYEHDETGATGFVINKPMDVDVVDILEKLALRAQPIERDGNNPVMIGGPVKQDQLFVLLFEKQQQRCQLSRSKDMLAQALDDSNISPIGFMGYASWASGQLEQEIAENSWLISAAKFGCLCKVPHALRYQTATSLLGFDMERLSDQVGHA